MKDENHSSIHHFRDTVGRGMIAHMMVVTHFLQKNTQEKLLESGRYKKLSLTFALYIPLLADKPRTPGDLAASLGTTKQACSKVIRELETLGFVSRKTNPADSRSSLLSLTPTGLQLLQDGMQITTGLHRELADEIGESHLQDLERIAETLRQALDLPLVGFSLASRDFTRAPRLNALLPVLSESLRTRLANDLAKLGFDDVKSSHGQVLGLVGRQGRPIKYMTSILGVSKQSMAASVAELHKLGYVTREADPADRRQVIVRLAAKGERLLAESIRCVQALEKELRTLIGADDYQVLEATMEALYLKVAEGYDSAGVLPARIQQLSDFLLEELGVAGTRTLAQHLLTITRGES